MIIFYDDVTSTVPHRFPIDIYALGVVLNLMLQLRAPIDIRSPSRHKLNDHQRELTYEAMKRRSYSFSSKLSPAAVDLIMGMLEFNPVRRYPIYAAMRHTWILLPTLMDIEQQTYG